MPDLCLPTILEELRKSCPVGIFKKIKTRKTINFIAVANGWHHLLNVQRCRLFDTFAWPHQIFVVTFQPINISHDISSTLPRSLELEVAVSCKNHRQNFYYRTLLFSKLSRHIINAPPLQSIIAINLIYHNVVVKYFSNFVGIRCNLL